MPDWKEVMQPLFLVRILSRKRSMPNTQTSSSKIGSGRVTGVLTGPLHIPGYRFKSETTSSLTHGESVDICNGFRIASKSPIVAKVSTDSSCFEREFYIMKKLYRYKEGPSYIVRPLEYINMPSGLTVAIYADEGQNYFQQDVYDSTSKSFSGSSDDASTTGSGGSSTLRFWVRNRQNKHYNSFDNEYSTPMYDLCTFLRFAIKCTDCLEFIHRHNIVHGELRLSSFQWDGNDQSSVKIWNFSSGTKSLETYLTSKGWRKSAQNKEHAIILQNLLVYMSPEQTGRTTYVPDHRTDIYSLGIVFFILLSGQAPFDGGPLNILNGILSRRIPLVHSLQLNVPEILSRIVEKMLHKVPDDRYTSARGIRADLSECLNRLSKANESSTEIIPAFPLAQYDVASVFTLPKTIYGRQDVILEMKTIIERAASLYEPSRFQDRSRLDMHVDDDYMEEKNKTFGDNINVFRDVAESQASPTSSVSFPNNIGDKDDASSISSKMMDIVNSTGASIVGLYGPGGAGKSTLYTAVQSIARKNGFMARAKFDSRNKVPYATVLQCLSKILQQILSESQDEIARFYDHLRISLGAQFNNITLLTDFVPELRPLLQMCNTSTYEAQNNQADNIDQAKIRFQKVFVEVFRGIALWRMTNLFLDDLHQADDPSLELIEALIMDRVKILMFLSYRDNEMTPKFSELLDNKNVNVHFIKIEPLTMESLINFIGDTLRRPRTISNKKALIPLGDIIFRKTRGNPFYIAQLLQTLERKKMIFFDWENNQWDYDIQEIEAATIYGSVDGQSQLGLSFIIERLRELPKAGQSLLTWASFAGDTFSWKMIKSLMVQVKDERSCSLVASDDFIPNVQDHTFTACNVDDDDYEASTAYTKPTSPTSIQASDKDSLKNSDYNPVSGLQAVLQEGYIMCVDGDEYKWCHDRISQAASELADPAMREKIHLTIAKYLMQEKGVDVFLAADHLLRCHNLLKTLDDKESYRQLMIDAGIKGQASGANAMALAYYELAIELADPRAEWNSDSYDATLQLYSSTVALSWAVGEIKKTEKLLEILFRKTKKPIDRVPAYLIKAQYYFGRQMHEQGREALFQYLDELGNERERMDISDGALARDYAQGEQLVDSLGSEGILKLEACADTELAAAMTVMDELLAISYFNGRKKEWYYWAMRILYISITRGPTSVTGNACTTAGVGFSCLYRKYKFGELLGAIAISIADKHSNNQDKGRVRSLYATFVGQWNRHYKETLDFHRSGLQFAHIAGDRLFGVFGQLHTCAVKFSCGYHASDVLRESMATYDDIHCWSPTIDHNTLLMCIIRATKALQGKTYSHTPNVFDGDDGYNDDHYLDECSKYSSNFGIVLNWYKSYKIIPQTLYGHLDEAIEAGYACVKTIDDHPLQRCTRVMLFYFSLALIDKAHEDPAMRMMHLRQVKENQLLLYEWAINSRINYMMFWIFIEAELIEFSDHPDILKAIRLYDEAINTAREGGWYFDLSVMHEYTGAFYLRVGLNNNAYGYITKAIELYTSHGSYGKAKHVSSKYANILSEIDDKWQGPREMAVQTDPIAASSGEPKWSSSSSSSSQALDVVELEDMNKGNIIAKITTEQVLITLDILDMASILKSSQVLSSEVKFQGLVKSMMNIILENSAADCGAIIIKDKEYGICAFGSQEQESTTTYDPPRPLLEKDGLVSSKIINHTIHTGESLFIHDVEQDSRFTVGTWFERTKNKSVICMPIIHKITTVGCLFIEGPVGIFTQRHATVLSLLCQQMGISITNAFLFKSVERVTMANMKMIEMQKQALEEARRSKEEAVKATKLREIFLANMSHEIRTPFSGFYGMISLLSETNLDPEQRDMVQTAKGSCEMLLQLIDDLLNFSKLRAGKVTLDLSPVILHDVVADVVEIMIAIAIQKGINITYTIEKDVPAVVIADANRLRQIVTNLLGNAIKFTHAGEIIIRCSLDPQRRMDFSQCEDQKVPLLIEVIDTGIGISREQREILFVPFSQVDGSTTRKYGGTGLGLSICLQLVELMSGTIDVSSIPGQGSNFHFTLQTDRASEHQARREKMIYEILQPLKQTRILVADKHVSTVIMIQKLLPEIKVDGVCTITELLSQQAKDYPIVVVGLLLTQDPDFEMWSEHLYRFLEHSQCVLMMHYPTAAVGDLLDQSRLISDSINLSKELNNKIDVRSSGTSANSKSAADQTIDQRILVRIPVPLRKVSLLQTLADLLRRTTLISRSTQTSRPAITLTSPRISEGTTSTKLFSPEERQLLTTLNVLVAEDNPVAQKLLNKQLTRLGLKVVCANDGLEAVEAWTSHPSEYFKMAFFDHHMPKCDGVEATKRIREIEKKEKRGNCFTIVTLSADIQDSAREKCLNAGMNDYFTKPMSQKTLSEALKRYCLN